MAVSEPSSEESVTMEVTGEASDPLVGALLAGRFRVDERVGVGAMGKVYRATQLPLNRPVALKILDSRYGVGRDESFRQRFLVEAALTAKLSHPNTVRVLDYGSTDDGLFFLVMEYLAGVSLEVAFKKGPMPWRRVLGVGQQIARALKEAHSLGVVHRDLKPANVILLDTDDDTDHLKVLDFGLVKSFVAGQELEGRAITQQGMLMGSPPYMAPEQGERNRADPRSDIYSLGVLLFEALTGKTPFDGVSALDIILKHVHEPLPPIVTPPGLEPIPASMVSVVQKCLAKSPMDRFQSMDEVLVALQEIIAPIRTPATELPASNPENPIDMAALRSPARSPVVLGLGFLLAMAAGVAVAVWAMHPGAVDVLEPAPVVPPAPVTAVPPPAEAEAAAVPAPAPARVAVHVESDPSGALVSRDGEVLGTTPLDFQQPVAAKGLTTLDLTFVKAGYVTKVVSATATSARLEVSEKLSPVAKAALGAPESTRPARLRRGGDRKGDPTEHKPEVPERKVAEPSDLIPLTPPAPPAPAPAPTTTRRKNTADGHKAGSAPAATERRGAKLDEDEDPPAADDLKRPPGLHPGK